MGTPLANYSFPFLPQSNVWYVYIWAYQTVLKSSLSSNFPFISLFFWEFCLSSNIPFLSFLIFDSVSVLYILKACSGCYIFPCKNKKEKEKNESKFFCSYIWTLALCLLRDTCVNGAREFVTPSQHWVKWVLFCYF